MKYFIEIIIFVEIERKIFSDHVKNHCHLTGKYRGPVHNKCNIKVTQKKKEILFHFYLLVSVIMIVIYSSKK